MGLYNWLERQEGGVWGVVVVFAAFMIQIPSFGTAQSFGIYNMYLLDYFDDSTAAVSLIGSINVGVFLGSGPIASFLMSRMSHRKVSLLGATLSCVGLIALPFTPNIIYMYGFYGIIAGLGFCLVYVPSHVLCGLYYDKKRSLATGIATSGSGFGAIIFPLLVNLLVEEYGWKGSFYLVCGVSMQNFVFASLLRPVPKALSTNHNVQNTQESTDPEQRSGTKQAKVELISYRHITTVSHSHEGVNGSSDDRGDVDVKENDITVEMPLEITQMREEGDTEPNIPTGNGNPEEKDLGEPKDKSHSDLLCKQKKSETEIDSELSSNPGSPAKLLQMQDAVDRQDGGNVSPGSGTSDMNDFNEVEKHAMTKKSTISILCNYTFVIFFINNIFWNMGMVIILLFGPQYFTTVGLTQRSSALVFSIGGIGAVIGSILGGILGNIEKLRLDFLYIGVVTTVGISGLLFPITYFHTFSGLTIIYVIFSVLANIIMGLLVVVLAVILGPEALGVGMGYVMFANGIGSAVAPPLAGWVYEQTGQLDLVFYLGGAIIIFSGLIICLIPIIDHFYLEEEKSHKKPEKLPKECLQAYCM